MLHQKPPANLGGAKQMIPVDANRRLIALIVVLNLLQFPVIPSALLPISAEFGWLLALCVMATPTHWSLIHEAIHGHLVTGKRANDVSGRALSVLFGSPFQLLRFGHLMHHRFNRTSIQRSDVSPDADGVRLRDNAWYFFLITIGLYVFELASAVFALLPNALFRKLVSAAFGDHAPDGRTMEALAKKHLAGAPGWGMLRTDGLLICLMVAASFWAYGPDWWMLATALVLRGVIVSALDNIYHYGNQLDDPQAGYNLRLPRMVENAFLNFNLHEVHHKHPTQPWSELPNLLERNGGGYHHSFGHAMMRQFCGLIPQRLAASGDLDLRNGARPDPRCRWAGSERR